MKGNLVSKAPVPNKNFLPIKPYGKSTDTVQGELHIPEFQLNSDVGKITAHSKVKRDPNLFPEIRTEFFSHKGYIVPVDRNLIFPPKNSQSWWQVVFQPGQIWSEKRDKGWSRASLPFLLVNEVENETHNGLISFLYRDSQISNVQYQIVQQTAPFLIDQDFKSWGRFKASFLQKEIKNLTNLKEQFENELKSQLNVYPFKEYSSQFSLSGQKALEKFNGNSEAIVISGLTKGNKIFLKDQCPTSQGPLPYCSWTRFGVWSVTKSLINTTQFLYLSKKAGRSFVEKSKIKDFVNVTATHNGWENVRFIDALDMATGIGNGEDSEIPPDTWSGYHTTWWYEYWLANHVEEKLKYVFKVKNHPWEPGKYVKYRSQDHFILSVAMNEMHLKLFKEPLWTAFKRDVLNKINIIHAPLTFSRASGGYGRVPVGAYGFLPTIQDVAKIMGLLQTHGESNGEQLFLKDQTKEIVRGASGVHRLSVSDRYKKQLSYGAGFWYYPYPAKQGCSFQIPEMNGYGAQRLNLMPNGISTFRFSWNRKPKPKDNWSGFSMAKAIDAVEPFECQ